LFLKMHYKYMEMDAVICPSSTTVELVFEKFTIDCEYKVQ